MTKSKVIALPLIVAMAMIGGGAASYAGMAFAQTATTSTGSTNTSTPTHAPLGNDGTVTSINGSTIVTTEESNEGGAAYTVDANGATVTNKGATAQLSQVKVGDKIFVQGTVSGTNVAATSLSLGQGGGHAPIGQDGTMTAISGTTITMQEETNEGGTSYTVDASSATVTKDGATSALSALAVGDKIFVEGSVSGTNVTATSIADGHPHGGFDGPGGR